MREIKFRAWTKDDIIDNWFMIDGEDLAIDGEDLAFEEFAPLVDLLKDTDNQKFMQYTGLKDKNGVDIYEGDIIKWVTTFNTTSKTEHIDTMEWCPKVVAYLLMPHVHEPHGADMEIIGNIYENPDL